MSNRKLGYETCGTSSKTEVDAEVEHLRRNDDATNRRTGDLSIRNDETTEAITKIKPTVTPLSWLINSHCPPKDVAHRNAFHVH